MADKSIPSLSEQYALPSEEKPVESKPSEVEKTETSPTPSPEEVADEKVLEASAAVEESSDVAPADAVQENSDESAPVTEESNEAQLIEDSGSSEDANEETPEVKLETAPADFRFPTTNQTRHCFTRYITAVLLPREKIHPSVISLQSTTALSALVNGLTGGTSKGRMVPFRGLYRMG